MKSVPLSVRITQEDSDFLAQLNVDDAKTPSDKVRSLIQQARRDSEEARSYTDRLAHLQQWFRPTRDAIYQREEETDQHSELVRLFLDWLVEASAFTSTFPEEMKGDIPTADLHDLEKGMLERTIRLCDVVLRLGVTPSAPCYDPDVFKDRLQTVIELAEIIKAHTKGKEASHG